MKGKLWTVLAVMVILSLGLVACGPTPAPPPPTEVPTEAPPPPAETPTAPPPAVEVEDEWGVVTVAAGDPIKVGFAAGLSGAGIDVLGLDEQRGAELAVKDKPEILGFAVELQVEDSQCNAEGGQTVATKFVADPQIVALVGHMCSSSCTPASKVYEQNHYTMVSPSCTAPSLTNPDLDGTAAFFRTCWNDKIQGPAAAKFVYETLGVTKVATVHDGSPYAEQLGQEFSKGFEALGGEVVAAEAVNVGDTDMRPVLTRIKAAEPELIYFSAFVAEGGYMRSQMADVGMEDVLFMGADGIKADEFIRAAGDASEGVYASAGNPAEAGPDLPAFLAAYEAEYGEAPIAPFHAQAYDAYMVIANAIEQVGVVDADGNLLIGRKALNEAIRGTTGYQGLSGMITCDENGDCAEGTVAVSMVQGGAWVAAEAPAAPPVAEGALIIGTTDSWSSWEISWVYSFHDWELFHNCADGLLNAIPGTAGEVEPALAESYTVSDDGLEYTFKIREGVVFPNGDPLTADEVVWSLNRVWTIQEIAGDNANFLVTAYVDSVEKVDDMTVKVTFNDTYAFAPQLVATNPWKIINPNQWTDTEANTDNTACGIGPYVVTSFTEGEELVFDANPTYYGDPPVSEKVVVRYFADSPTMALALQTGEIDVAWKSLAPADLAAIEGVEGITVEEAGSTEIRYIVYNSTTPPFDNPKVRLGLAMLLGREELCDLGWQGIKVPLHSMVPPGFLGYKPTYEGTEDVEGGKALLAEAGFTEDNPLVMDLWYSPTHYGDTEVDVATVIKQQLEASGVVKAELQFLEWAAYRDAGRAGDLPFNLLGWYPDYLDPDNYTNVFAHSPAAWSGSFYSNPEMDALLEAQAGELDEDARIAILEDIQDLWVTESPFVPLGQGKLFIGYRDGISGIVLDPLAQLHYFLIEKAP